MIPAGQLPRGGGGVWSRGGSHSEEGAGGPWVGDERVGGALESRPGPQVPLCPQWRLQVTVPLGPLCQRSGGTPAALAACQALY